MPLKELKAYKRIELHSGAKAHFEITVSRDSFCYYDRRMNYGLHNGDFTVSAGTSSTDILYSFEVKVREGKISLK